MWNRLHTMKKIIQVVMDEETLRQADREAKRARVNRSELIRRAVAHYAAARRRRALEERHRAGYERTPVEPGELDVFAEEQAWPED
jgi:metal-responsive CopG/Arc/MetJ family transcriptional regulator